MEQNNKQASKSNMDFNDDSRVEHECGIFIAPSDVKEQFIPLLMISHKLASSFKAIPQIGNIAREALFVSSAAFVHADCL